MEREGALVSVQILHHCKKKNGVVSAMVEFRGRDRWSAILAWNTRSALTQPVETLEQTRERFIRWYEGEMPEEVGNKFHCWWVWLTALQMEDTSLTWPERKKAQPVAAAGDDNQCDGCRAGYPVNERGFHIMGSGKYPDLMACQAYRYRAVQPDEARVALTEASTAAMGTETAPGRYHCPVAGVTYYEGSNYCDGRRDAMRAVEKLGRKGDDD
jgi:hypothetical protein